MGIYAIQCPQCKKSHLWFSGIVDQRCEAWRTTPKPESSLHTCGLSAEIRRTNADPRCEACVGVPDAKVFEDPLDSSNASWNKPTAPREFWIRERDGHFENGAVNETEALIDSIHVIEYAAYKALEELKEVRAQRNESWAVAKELREGNELGALMIMDTKARAERLIEALKHIKLTAMGSTMVQFIRETIEAYESEGK